MSKRSLGVLSLIGAAIFWGYGPIIAKQGLMEVPPFSLGFLRNILALGLLFAYIYPKGLLKVKRADLYAMLLIGLFGSGLNTIFFLSGLNRTSATASIAIFATVPLINIAAASLILKENLTKLRVLGVVIGFLGSSTIALGPAFLGKHNIDGDSLGNLLVVGAAISWVVYMIGSKKLMDRYSPITIIFYSILIGSISLLPFAFSELISHPNWYLNLGIGAFSSIIYGGIISGILAFALFQWGMKYTSAIEAGMVIYLQLLVTDVFATKVLGEQLSPLFLFGTSLIIGGVFLATTYELIKKRSNT